MLVRPARPQEAPALAALAVRSKGHWPYSREFLRKFADTMGLTSEVVAANDVQVGERHGELRGFYTLLHRGPLAVLDDLWLEPGEIGRGSGRLLFEHATARAAAAGAAVLEWEAEPYAVDFYTRMGGRTVRWTDSPLGRSLPVMQLPLARAARRSTSSGPLDP